MCSMNEDDIAVINESLCVRLWLWEEKECNDIIEFPQPLLFNINHAINWHLQAPASPKMSPPSCYELAFWRYGISLEFLSLHLNLQST